jgi:mRNA interferase RelE/StbE
VDINYSKLAVKFLKKQNKTSQDRIMDAIERIPEGNIIKLQGISGYRLRVGNYRILFDFSGNSINIINIDNRGEVYK